ncbi:hypothetical protein SUNI508_05900 [Seiridium unicorne]|uniref:Uncharacterized protein n=1 Tax=Seiridium unicorne TaxID=138068 RepID=A0ABR2V3B7_9PEZI
MSNTHTMWTSEIDLSLDTAATLDTKMGREPCQAPTHLSRVLYLPHHDDTTVHLPIYEVGSRYRSAVRNALLGSTLYTTMLGFMETPQGNDMNDRVAYLADIQRMENGVLQIHLDRRELEILRPDTLLTMTRFSPSLDVTPTVMVRSGEVAMKMSTFYPIAESTRGKQTIKHPFFTMTTAKADNERPVKLEWQIDPVKDGMLRYTLVEQDEHSGTTVYAIYHHKGWAVSLSLPYSDGILLLPETNRDIHFEGIVVASLLVLLAQLRILSVHGRGDEKPGQAKSLIRRATSILHRQR